MTDWLDPNPDWLHESAPLSYEKVKAAVQKALDEAPRVFVNPTTFDEQAARRTFEPFPELKVVVSDFVPEGRVYVFDPTKIPPIEWEFEGCHFEYDAFLRMTRGWWANGPSSPPAGSS